MAQRKKTPQNKVGHRVPTKAEVEAERKRVKDLKAFAASLGPTLNKEERRAITKPRKGAEVTCETVLGLAADRKLTSRLITIEAAQRDQALFASIVPLIRETYDAWSHLRDIYLQARAENWEAVLAFYGVLDAMAQNDPDLDGSLEPVVDFFANGPQASDTKPDDQAEDKDDDQALE